MRASTLKANDHSGIYISKRLIVISGNDAWRLTWIPEYYAFRSPVHHKSFFPFSCSITFIWLNFLFFIFPILLLSFSYFSLFFPYIFLASAHLFLSFFFLSPHFLFYQLVCTQLVSIQKGKAYCLKKNIQLLDTKTPIGHARWVASRGCVVDFIIVHYAWSPRVLPRNITRNIVIVLLLYSGN